MPTDDELLRQYLDLVTSAHNQMPRYMATVGLSLRPHIQSQLEACRIIGLYDLDTAVAQQLDFTGQWIGLSRFLQVEVAIWFSFDTRDLGFDQGRWMVPFEEEFNIIRLEDEDYRNLLRAKVLANYWDGTIPGAYRAWDQLFGPSGYKLVIQDQGARPEPDTHGNMHVWQILFGPPMSQVTQILFAGGYLGLKSAGVGTGYLIQSQPSSGFDGTNLPMFAFDTAPKGAPQSAWDIAEGGSDFDANATVWDAGGTAQYPDVLFAGFDEGAWGQVITAQTISTGPPVPPVGPGEAQTQWDIQEGGSDWDSGMTEWDLADSTTVPPVIPGEAKTDWDGGDTVFDAGQSLWDTA